MTIPQYLDPAADLDLGKFRPLNSGVYVPEDEQATAPIDIVDREPGPVRQMPVPRPPEPPAPPAAAPPPVRDERVGDKPPAPEQKQQTKPQQSTSDAPVGPGGWQRVGHALADMLETHSQRRRARRARPAEADSDITIVALVVVSLVTITVAGLAFALSFSMMLAAALKYGWTPELAKLFPILIDVGAIGGTFMGAISANRTYVRVGRSVLVLTLAASVLFNLVGHDVKGGEVLDLPAEWKWTGTVAAVFIPIVLAYFVHAFSKALKAYMDQQRERAAAVDREKALQAKAAAKAQQQSQAQPAAAKPRERDAVSTPAPRRSGGGKASKDDAIRVGVRRKASTPATLREALKDAGYSLPSSSSTIENWCRLIKAELASA